MNSSDAQGMTIVVDADACPVKKETADIARACGVPVMMVSSYAHELRGGEGVAVVRVDNSDQSADLYIANHIKPGDVVLTGDYGLAALALAKGCHVLSFRGQTYDETNMDMMLEGRHARAKERRRGRHPKAQNRLPRRTEIFST